MRNSLVAGMAVTAMNSVSVPAMANEVSTMANTQVMDYKCSVAGTDFTRGIKFELDYSDQAQSSAFANMQLDIADQCRTEARAQDSYMSERYTGTEGAVDFNSISCSVSTARGHASIRMSQDRNGVYYGTDQLRLDGVFYNPAVFEAGPGADDAVRFVEEYCQGMLNGMSGLRPKLPQN